MQRRWYHRAMAIDFYYGSGSPFAWRVWLALEYKQLPYTLHVISFAAGEHRTPAYAAINPRKQVPAIVHDGFALFESLPILEYLDEAFAETPRIYPSAVRDRAICRRLVREIDNHAYAATRMIADELWAKPDPAGWRAEALERGRARVRDEWAYFANEMRGDWLLGDAPTAADFTLYPVIATHRRFEKKKPDLWVDSAMPPKLDAWAQRVEALPFFDKTFPPHWR